jgi:DNA-binding GntR family transcriptional regulator
MRTAMAASLRTLDRPLSLSDQTYAALRDQLRAGRFSGGRALLEASLAAQLGVSRTPVREALLRLACEGLLEPAGRSFVRPVLSRADVNEIYELRLLLEPEAVRQVARQFRGTAWLKPIREHLATMVEAQAVGDADAFIDANDGYRAAWLELVPNRRLLRAIELYADHVRYLRLLTLGEHSTRKVVITGLKRLTAAFAAAKPREAATAMRDHLGQAKRFLQEALDLEENGDLENGL